MDPWQSPCQAVLESYTPYSVPCVTLQMNAMQRKVTRFFQGIFPTFAEGEMLGKAVMKTMAHGYVVQSRYSSGQ